MFQKQLRKRNVMKTQKQHLDQLLIKLPTALLINLKSIMNKIAFLFIVISILFLSSCRKDRKCTCTETYNGVEGTPTLTVYEKSTRAEARTACHSYTETLSTGGVQTFVCELQ